MKNMIHSLSAIAALFVMTAGVALAQVPPNGSVPEPEAWALLGIGGLAVWLARRSRR